MNNKLMKANVQEYISYRRKLGYDLRSQEFELLQFARFADERGHTGALTNQLIVDWATSAKNVDPTYKAKKLQCVGTFAKYRAIYDPKTEIPPRGILGRVQLRQQPVIYSEEILKKLLTEIRKIKSLNSFKKETYETVLGLLLCTGLRISEALNLLDDEVDLKNGILRVIETKFSKSRLVPLHPTAQEALLRYKEKRDRSFPRRFTNAFFVGDKGIALTYAGLQSKFWKFKKDAGLEKDLLASNPFHCFRHTFVVRRLLAWHQNNEDTEQKIAALSTYLGHAKVSDTYWYFSGIPELMEIVSKRFEQLTMLKLERCQ